MVERRFRLRVRRFGPTSATTSLARGRGRKTVRPPGPASLSYCPYQRGRRSVVRMSTTSLMPALGGGAAQEQPVWHQVGTQVAEESMKPKKTSKPGTSAKSSRVPSKDDVQPSKAHFLPLDTAR